ncbi:nitrilase [Purpureocillium lilacinum]|uniref:Nitrilase n=1 Tax=Purpureocillium lilacinum TaxID=33203 RepID=A0A2U3EPA3_PURLI|nr:nitrilase [Purpureocillium lilacinum]
MPPRRAWSTLRRRRFSDPSDCCLFGSLNPHVARVLTVPSAPNNPLRPSRQRRAPVRVFTRAASSRAAHLGHGNCDLVTPQRNSLGGVHSTPLTRSRTLLPDPEPSPSPSLLAHRRPAIITLCCLLLHDRPLSGLVESPFRPISGGKRSRGGNPPPAGVVGPCSLDFPSGPRQLWAVVRRHPPTSPSTPGTEWTSGFARAMCEAASNAVFRIAGAMCIERLVPPHLRQLGEARAVFWRVVFIIMHFSHQVLEASLTRSMHVASPAAEARVSTMTGSLKQAAESARNKTTEVMNAAKGDGAAVANDILHTPLMRAALPFINGGISGMVATTVIQPVDMVKVRIQLAGEGTSTGPKPTPLSVTRQIISSGKVLDLYTGLSAGLLRQAVYTTARLGLFDTIMGRLTARAKAQDRSIGFRERATAGLTAGGIAAMIGNPADLALIRMQSDGLKPLAERKNYKSVIDALGSIAKSEGVGALWSGAAPTVVRAMALNFGQLAFFSEAKVQLKQKTDMSARSQTLAASAIAGFFASFFSLPFDFVKTRLQKQQKGPDGKLPYKGMADCFAKVAKQEGILRFYRGFSTYYVRIAPHAMVTLIVADYLGWLTK